MLPKQTQDALRKIYSFEPENKLDLEFKIMHQKLDELTKQLSELRAQIEECQIIWEK